VRYRILWHQEIHLNSYGIFKILNKINGLQRSSEVDWRKRVRWALERHLWSTFLGGAWVEGPKPLCKPDKTTISCL
jgi:hypothetical protein